MKLPFNKVVLVLFAISLFNGSCQFLRNCEDGEGEITNQDVQIGSFNAIELSSNCTVYLSQSVNQKVSIKAQQNIISLLNTDVSRKKWDIGFDNCFNTNEVVEVHIAVPSLTEINLHGSGKIIGEEVFEENQMELNLNGSGSMDLNLNVKELISEVDGSGILKLKGYTKLHQIEINGSGDVAALDLSSNESTIEINGSGDAKVHVTYGLDVEVNGSGDVFYKGDVKSINSQINGSGSLIQSN